MGLHLGIAAIYQYRDFAAAGGLLSYGASYTEPMRLVGAYTGRVLKGEMPSELPVQESTKVELFINLKTANALGLTIPQAFLVPSRRSDPIGWQCLLARLPDVTVASANVRF